MGGRLGRAGLRRLGYVAASFVNIGEKLVYSSAWYLSCSIECDCNLQKCIAGKLCQCGSRLLAKGVGACYATMDCPPSLLPAFLIDNVMGLGLGASGRVLLTASSPIVAGIILKSLAPKDSTQPWKFNLNHLPSLRPSQTQIPCVLLQSRTPPLEGILGAVYGGHADPPDR
jgi:hypothetical protein